MTSAKQIQLDNCLALSKRKPAALTAYEVYLFDNKLVPAIDWGFVSEEKAESSVSKVCRLVVQSLKVKLVERSAA